MGHKEVLLVFWGRDLLLSGTLALVKKHLQNIRVACNQLKPLLLMERCCSLKSVCADEYGRKVDQPYPLSLKR